MLLSFSFPHTNPEIEIEILISASSCGSLPVVFDFMLYDKGP
jgi:hypothetical protein